jgi:adenylate cyclase
MRRIVPPPRTIRDGTIELFHPGQTELTGRDLWDMGVAFVGFVIVLTNVIGAVAVVVIALFVVPEPHLAHAAHVRLVNAIAAGGYVLFAVPVGTGLGIRSLFSLRQWLIEDQPPSLAVIRTVLRAPLRLFLLQVALWLIAAVGFAVLNSTFSAWLGLIVFIVVSTTGVVTATCAYLLTEITLRPAAARALADGAPERLVVPGVATRSVAAWVLGTGTTTFGMVAIGAVALAHIHSLYARPTQEVHQLGISMVVLGATGLAVGLLATILIARITADPLDSVRGALARVQRGELDVRVPVYDGTQIGQLQLGFNEMVEGLQERERIREAFGTYVDPEVAEHVLQADSDLAGVEVEVTVMFVDIRNFTGFAERTTADRVVAAVNALFERIVPIIHDHGGRIDKFIGDGLMAVFGAPRRQPDHADQALAAALQIAAAVGSEKELAIGVGLNSGRVVAGNVGGDGRFEFSVIGDPVNIAARVEAATRVTGDTILLTETTAELLRAPHPPLAERPGVELKGKTAAVRLLAPERSASPATGSRDP